MVLFVVGVLDLNCDTIKSMINQKSFPILVIIFLVVILGLGGGAYLYIKNSTLEAITPIIQETKVDDSNTTLENPPSNSETQVVKNDDTVASITWKVFFDEKLKIGFSYPSYLSIKKDNIINPNSDFIKTTLTDGQNNTTEIVFPVDESSRLNGKEIKDTLVEDSKIPDAKGRPRTLIVDGKTFHINYSDFISYSLITNRGIVDVSFSITSGYSQLDIKKILSSLKY